MPQPPTLDALKSLIPGKAQVVLSAQAPTDENRVPATEMAAMTAMKPDRRKEFIHGRTCARTALSALGWPDQAIPVGASREPVWPDGIVGSISHCGHVAAAAAARCDDFDGLGIDLETAEPLDAATLNLICRAAERSWLEDTDDPLHFAKLIFSAKESIFKCVWPTIGQFIDFQDIGIRVDTGAGVFTPVAWVDDLPDPVLQRITGRYLLHDGWIMTSACLSRHIAGSGS